jgi:foldase protein PrsA
VDPYGRTTTAKRDRWLTEPAGRVYRPIPRSFLILVVLFLLVFVLGGCASDDDRGPAIESQGIEATVQPSDQQGQGAMELASDADQGTEIATVTPPAPLAATVNGQYIFLADYERKVTQYEQALADQGLDLDTEEGQDNLYLVGYDVLESMIDSALIQQAAVKLGVALTDDELAATMEEDIATGGGQDAFDEWLEATDQTRDDYADMLQQSLLSQRILDLIAADIPETAEQVRARHIVVDDEADAEEILALLNGGADFAKLAEERSQDFATSDVGGDLGWLVRGLIMPELESVAFTLEVGQTSDVIPLEEGFYIIRVEEREDERRLSQEMIVDLKLSLFDQWLDEQRAAAVIDRFAGE